MNRIASPFLLSVGLVSLLAACPAMAQDAAPAAPAAAPAPAATPAPDYSAVEEKSTDLGNGIYEITGAGGNTTVAISDTGVIVIDTQFAPLYDKLRAKITSLTDKPILYVFNTHYHGDHTGGNDAFFRKDNAVIVAHPQVAERMINPPGGVQAAGLTQEALPNAPYAGNGTIISAGSITAQLSHPVPTAHTDGDTIVIFNKANVIATGDIVSTASYPNIDVAVGGNIDGMIAATNFIIAHCDRNTKIVPGHGPITDKGGVTDYRDMLQDARDRIAKAKAKGMTEQQVVDANLLADYDKKWKAPGNAMAARFPVNVYRSLKDDKK